ncbi:cation transporting ATPase 13A3 [Echinococcus multilocularis]|uniref:Cation-transporting ATPase n=1 Tax=Echinococcus multilocularis TaxID=6211 RepID=A0A068Y3C0_ECHMU|nr:cation transporting ATPase 13A3 [Echinococcus multilocularis]
MFKYFTDYGYVLEAVTGVCFHTFANFYGPGRVGFILQLAYQFTMINCDPHCDDSLKIVGYRRNWFKTSIIWIATAFSGFTLTLLFYWRQDYWIALTHTKVKSSQAENASLGIDISYVYVQCLTTNRVHLYKFSEEKHASETSPLCSVKYHKWVKFFFYQNLKYIWCNDKGTFLPLKGLDRQNTLETLHTKPLTKDSVDYLLALYGSNQINIPLTPIFVKLFRENERQLRDKVKMAETVLVLRDFEKRPRKIPSTDLVPGDVVCIPPYGCELVADMLLISGSCTVNEASLNGESVPQAKSSIAELPTPTTDEDRKIDIRRLSRHVLFSGTRVLQARESPDGHLVKAVVLRTGFLTVKGDLVRAILHPKPLDIHFNLDSFRFLAIMAVIAISGFIYTWVILHQYRFGLGKMIRKSLDILTIVVPPALPSVMTTGLYLAQMRLKKQGIFCINPSAINVAGTLNTVVFDKTGTLTEEHMSVRGVWKSGLSCDPPQLYKMEQVANIPGPLSAVLAACHSLTFDLTTCKIFGDPLDRVIFISTNWSLQESSLEEAASRFTSPIQAVIYNTKIESTSPWQKLGVLRRFPFSPTAQRQSVVVETVGSEGEIVVLSKGAPEAIVRHCDFQTVPKDFENKLSYFARRGHRVLALAWKPICRTTNSESGESGGVWVKIYQFQKREDFECDLRFLGLVVLDNPPKPESEPTISELLNANFRVIMATGDNILTSVSVARQCGIIKATDVVVQVTPSNNIVRTASSSPSSSSPSSSLLTFEVLTTSDDSEKFENSVWIGKILEKLSQSVSHCIGSTVVVTVDSGEDSAGISESLRLVMTGTTWNFIRMHAPHFLSTVVSYGTVFARFLPDDKTSLIVALQTKGGDEDGALRRVGMCGDGANDCGALKAAYIGVALSDCEASVAAPFTARQQNILCVANILKEGRCSLSTAIGSFKYMVLYSFTQFFTVLLLYNIGNTLTDPEYLIIDLFIVAPLCVTYAVSRPWEKLEASTIPLRLMTPSNLASVFLQLFLAVATQIVIFIGVQHQSWWSAFEPTEHSLDSAGSYETTSLFYFSCFQYIFMCVALAKGPPFRDRIYRNRIFLLNVIILVNFTLGLLIFPTKPLSEWAKLLPLYGPNDVGFRKNAFSIAIIAMAFLHFMMAIAVETIIDRKSDDYSRHSVANCSLTRLCRDLRVRPHF